MSRAMPSMVALLGLLAVAGYQNRDKIKEALAGSNMAPGSAPGALAPQGAQPSAGGSLGGLLGGASLGSVLSGGLRDLVDRFKDSGHADTANSWVKTGPNQPIGADHLEQAIGPDVINALVQQTGLSREELLARLTKNVPGAIDTFTPQGRLPTEDEASKMI